MINIALQSDNRICVEPQKERKERKYKLKMLISRTESIGSRGENTQKEESTLTF